MRIFCAQTASNIENSATEMKTTSGEKLTCWFGREETSKFRDCQQVITIHSGHFASLTFAGPQDGCQQSLWSERSEHFRNL